MIVTSHGRIPVNRCNWTMARRYRLRYGKMGSTNSSDTGLIGWLSLAAVRPRRNPPTVDRAWHTSDGTSSFSTAHLKNRLQRLTCLLMAPRLQPSSIMRCRHAFMAKGPKVRAGWVP